MTTVAHQNPHDLARTLACGRCGTAFSCNLSGACWCAEEDFRLPVLAEGADDCICPECLHAMAKAAGTK